MGDVRGGDRQIAGLIVGRELIVPDEIVHGFGHRNGEPAGVLVQLGLRDQPAAAPGIEVHHQHHVAQVGLQAAVLLVIVPDQVDQHLLLDG